MESQGMAQMSSVDSLAASLLSATLMFDRASLLALEALAAESDRRVLRRGEVLVREGDASDRFFIVLSGRFTVYKGDSTGSVARSHRVNSSVKSVSSRDYPARPLSLQRAIRSS
ncbi:MAG: cyclic nucleotide-binding domain-containing protein [Mesorhizobium sp.]|nr:MAG: cyclic nucleotide-binding domain-containing protein [Mesorhizobium sp.]